MSYEFTLQSAPGTGLLTRKAISLLYVPDPGDGVEQLLTAFVHADDGTEFEALAEALMLNDFTLPPFACVVASERISLRVFGNVELRTDQRSVPMISGAGSTTWVDHLVHGSPDAAQIAVSDENLDVRTDIVLGTVHAGGFNLLLTSLAMALLPTDSDSATDEDSELDQGPDNGVNNGVNEAADDLVDAEAEAIEELDAEAIERLVAAAAAPATSADRPSPVWGPGSRVSISELERSAAAGQSELIDYVLGALGSTDRRTRPFDIQPSPGSIDAGSPDRTEHAVHPDSEPPIERGIRVPKRAASIKIAADDDTTLEPDDNTATATEQSAPEPEPDSADEMPRRPPLNRRPTPAEPVRTVEIIDDDNNDDVPESEVAEKPFDSKRAIKPKMAGRRHEDGRPMVRSRLCTDGHPNDPLRITCDVCSIFLEPGEDAVSLIPQPSPGRLVFDDGSILPLIEDIVIGRSPKRFADSGGFSPHATTGDRVSRAHLSLRLDHWDVLIEDCGSRNGSVVVDAEAGQPVGLVPGTPLLIEPGATVYFGSRSFVFERHDESSDMETKPSVRKANA